MTDEVENNGGTTIGDAAERTGLARTVIQESMYLGLVSVELDDGDLADLRRIRRLTELGLDLAGIEVVLRMRRQVVALLEELERQRGREKATAGLASVSSLSRQTPAIPEENR